MVSSPATASGGRTRWWGEAPSRAATSARTCDWSGEKAGVLDGDLDAAHLVFLIIALNAWWFSAPQLARMLTGADDQDPAEHARRRASVVRAAQRLALP